MQHSFPLLIGRYERINDNDLINVKSKNLVEGIPHC